MTHADRTPGSSPAPPSPRRDMSGVLAVLDARGVGQPASARRPVSRPMPRTWFLRSRQMRAYALREVSSFIVGLFLLDLVVGMVALHRGPQAWDSWVTLQRHPLNVVLIVFVLAMTLVHATTWYAAAPKIVRVRIGQAYLSGRWIVAAQYVVALAVLAATVVWIWRSAS
ncbi:hypothetical protein [Xylanimonas ulmi]|uniref:Fumarate reductase subunit C n=1 Tax=Xylanimonas ulmi TaxID=228973 RepID=A0A4Q7LZV4_9MICO|nr:hypothetical protein [Xylanibacterium ulmi]RZS59812.1 fumarate reductase subunit C [Xylanibacterium ulmi]